MSDGSSIEWTDATWNPVTGCTKVSPGCKNCYAERFAERFRGVSGHPFEQGFELKMWPNRLRIPLSWREPRRIFVNSMSDLFHERVPPAFIKSVFGVMQEASHHQFQVLTKRPERAAALAHLLPWPENVWMGTSIETQLYTTRLDALRRVPAKVRFLSCEPLLGPLQLNLEGIHWVITGGESGPGARPMDVAWVHSIHTQCRQAGVAHFFKQYGKDQNNPRRDDPTSKKNGGYAKGGRLLNGRTYDEMPVPILR
jgi:protein gp37